MMKILSSCQSVKGNYREKNQDRVVCIVQQDGEKAFAIAGICDGIGSMKMSEIASELVIEGIRNWYEGMRNRYLGLTFEEIQEDLEGTIYELNELVCEYQEQNNIIIGCTMSLFLLLDTEYYIFHVGDSRIYVVQNQVSQLTVDEKVNKSMDGKIKSYLANYIGKTKNLWLNRRKGNVKPEDMIVLGSDGLFQKLCFDDFKNIDIKIHSNKNMEAINKRMIDLVLKRGEKDNISCILLFMYGGNHYKKNESLTAR